ncbi:hypothetical protein GC197_00295 [bacterium]|nr:hypothetical protein [bacterium]
MSNIRPVATAEAASSQVALERFSGYVWGGLVIGMLGLQIVISVTAAVIATNSHSNDVVPDYYQKAVNYDNATPAVLPKE